MNQGAPQPQQQVGLFVGCRQTFSGAPDAYIGAFINTIIVYKDCANVSDASALLGSTH